MTPEDEILDVAGKWAEAMVANDADRIATFMAEEWVIVHEKGNIRPRKPVRFDPLRRSDPQRLREKG